jgi:hypothetical protein
MGEFPASLFTRGHLPLLDQLQATLAKSQVFHGNLGRQIKVFPDNVQQQFLSSTRWLSNFFWES